MTQSRANIIEKLAGTSVCGDDVVLNRRVTPTKALPLSIGDLTDAKMCELQRIRRGAIEVANHMTQAVFVDDFLAHPEFSPKTLRQQTLALQKAWPKGSLNRVYIEKARELVESSVWEQFVRAGRALCAALHNIDKAAFWKPTDLRRFEKRQEPVPLYRYVPVELQDQVTEAELDGIKSRFSAVSREQRLDWLRALLVDNQTCDALSPRQRAVIRHAYQVVRERFAMPRFGINDDFAVTIDLDYRLLAQGQYHDCVKQLDQHYQWLVDRDNAHYRFFLALSPPVPRAERIKLPLAIAPEVYTRLLGADEAELPSVTALSLVIRHDRVEMRAVARQTPIDVGLAAQYEQLKQADHLLARDFGYVDTVSLSVVRNDFQLSLDAFVARMTLDKAGVKALYQSHQHTPEVVERVQYSGRRFLARLAELGGKIDRYKSDIDHSYNKIEAVIASVKGYLGLEANQLLPPDCRAADPFVKHLIDKFWRQMSAVTELKKRVRGLYKKADGLKKSWFGFLTNIEQALLRKYNAVSVVEDLTVMVAEKDTPDYKGRAFNKMINNGSKGRYMRLAAQKCWWSGAPEVRLPAYYSSKTCTEHRLVEEEPRTMRRGKVFRCPQCSAETDADLHAADTLGSYLLLTPAPSG